MFIVSPLFFEDVDVMQLWQRMQISVVLLTFLYLSSTCFVVDCVKAEEVSASRADASFLCSFLSPSTLSVEVTLEIEEINVFDTAYTKEEIAAVAGSNPEILGAIKLRVRDLVKSQLQASFGNATLAAVNQIPEYSSDKFSDEFDVELSSDFFNLSETVDGAAVIAGILDSNGIVTYHMPLSAQTGWNNTYTFSLGSSLQLEYANTENVNVPAKKITWAVANWEGLSSSDAAELALQAGDPTSSLSEEKISLGFVLDTRQVDTTSFTVQIYVESLSLESYHFLPETIKNLPYAPSDTVRLFVENNLLSWEDIYTTTLKGIETLSIAAVERSELNQTLQTTFSFDSETTSNSTQPYNISHMDTNPPIQANIVDPSIDLRLAGATPRAFFGLINAGAQATISKNHLNFGEGLNPAPYNYTIRLHLPSNLTLDNQNPYSWNTSSALKGPLNSTVQPETPYTNEQIETFIVIDLQKMDLNIQRMFFGNTELTTTLHFDGQTSYAVLKKPSEFSLPEALQITYLNADAFRLCIEESLFPDDEIDLFLSNKKQSFEQLFSQQFSDVPIQSTTDTSVFYNSLSNWDGDISSMDAIIPIEYALHGTALTSLPFSLSLWPPTIELSNQTLTFTGIPGNAVTYEIVFPNGISINAESLQDRTFIKSKKPDGREYVQVSFDLSESSATDTIRFYPSASPLYIFVLFFPCLLSLLLVIFLIVIILLIKRRKTRKKPTPEFNDPTQHEKQDYYVPPPPQQ